MVFPICVTPDCGEMSTVSTVAGGQQQSSVVVFAERI
jgi:hypothetical protein